MTLPLANPISMVTSPWLQELIERDREEGRASFRRRPGPRASAPGHRGPAPCRPFPSEPSSESGSRTAPSLGAA